MVKRKRKASCSSSLDSDDECLSKLVSRKNNANCNLVKKFNINPQNKLCLRSHESCDFCDRTFDCRLQFLVHNAKHIIIPLIKCDSNEKFQSNNLSSQKPQHASPKFINNKIILGSKPKNIKNSNTVNENNDDVIVLSDSDNEIIVMDREKQIKHGANAQENVLNNFTSDCRVLLDPMDSIDFDKTENVVSKENILLNSLTVDCKVNLGKPMLLLHKSVENSVAETSILPIDDPNWPKSIHNDELLKPGLYKCEICKVHFPNRFDIIRHKARHLRVRRSYPGYCIVCETRRCCRMSPLCTPCEHRHGRGLYSESKMDECGDEPQKNTKETYKDEIRTVQLCEVCHMFTMRRPHQMKFVKSKSEDNSNYKYTKMFCKTKNQLPDTGIKHFCDQCQNGFAEINIVQKIKRHFYRCEAETEIKLSDRIQFEEDIGFKSEHRLGKWMSNAGRLSRIKRRIKKMKYINKF